MRRIAMILIVAIALLVERGESCIALPTPPPPATTSPPPSSTASPGSYNITNGFNNADASCEGTYRESRIAINPGVTSNIEISADVSCSAAIEGVNVNCIKFIGTIQDLIISPLGQNCIVQKKSSTEPTGSYTITNGFNNADTQCDGTYVKSTIAINPSETSNIQISATVSCSAAIEGVNVRCIKYVGPIKDLVITPRGQGCIVQPKSSPPSSTGTDPGALNDAYIENRTPYDFSFVVSKKWCDTQRGYVASGRTAFFGVGWCEITRVAVSTTDHNGISCAYTSSGTDFRTFAICIYDGNKCIVCRPGQSECICAL